MSLPLLKIAVCIVEHEQILEIPCSEKEEGDPKVKVDYEQEKMCK